MVEEQKPILKKVVKREQWSKLGFIFAVIASAVGIGNIWRFPYLAGKNGGGAFLIPYLIAVVLIAFPVVLLEFAAGWEFQTSILHFFKKLGARTKFLGWFFMVILLAILSYYVVIVGWILAYFIFSFTGYGTFASFSSSLLPILFFLACIAILFVVDSLGIKKGIEKLCKYTMPIVFIFLIINLIVDLIYSGNIESARKYVDLAWRDDKSGDFKTKDIFWEELSSQIKESPYYNDLEDFFGL